MKKFNFDNIVLSFMLGIIAPMLTFLLYYLINYNYMPIYTFINFIKLGNLFKPIISLCILSNLAIFYLYIWKNKYKGTRGVIYSTFIWAAFVIYLNFNT